MLKRWNMRDKQERPTCHRKETRCLPTCAMLITDEFGSGCLEVDEKMLKIQVAKDLENETYQITKEINKNSVKQRGRPRKNETTTFTAAE